MCYEYELGNPLLTLVHLHIMAAYLTSTYNLLQFGLQRALK